MIFHKVGSTRDRILAHFGKLSDQLIVSFELASIETVKKFVSIGMGIAVVPKSYALQEKEQGTLCLVRIRNLKMIRRLGLIYRKNRYKSGASKAFLHVVQDWVSSRKK
jgi:DNA-binding transcriptional LysR family regulator